MRVVFCVLALAALGSVAGSALAGEPPGRVIPDGTTSKGGDFAVFFDTDTFKVEGVDVDWGCTTVNRGKPAYTILTHKGIGRISSTGKLSLSSVALSYAKLHATKAVGTAKVTVNGTFQWGPETTTSIRRVTGKGTVVVKTASCTSGTLTFSVREH
jgi:hypothetical protein